MKTITPALLFCLAIAIASPSHAQESSESHAMSFALEHPYRLPAESNLANFYGDQPYWIEVKGGAWQLSSDELSELQKLLARAIEGKRTTPPLLDNQSDGTTDEVQQKKQDRELVRARWLTYALQYQGQIKDGKRVVRINGTCVHDDAKSLHEQFDEVFDGGPCYFTLKYDPATQRFFDFWVNGNA